MTVRLTWSGTGCFIAVPTCSGRQRVETWQWSELWRLWCRDSDAEDSESQIRVGFVTYSNVLHFYNLKVRYLQLGFFLSVCLLELFVSELRECLLIVGVF